MNIVNVTNSLVFKINIIYNLFFINSVLLMFKNITHRLCYSQSVFTYANFVHIRLCSIRFYRNVMGHLRQKCGIKLKTNCHLYQSYKVLFCILEPIWGKKSSFGTKKMEIFWRKSLTIDIEDILWSYLVSVYQ